MQKNKKGTLICSKAGSLANCEDVSKKKEFQNKPKFDWKMYKQEENEEQGL